MTCKGPKKLALIPIVGQWFSGIFWWGAEVISQSFGNGHTKKSECLLQITKLWISWQGRLLKPLLEKNTWGKHVLALVISHQRFQWKISTQNLRPTLPQLSIFSADLPLWMPKSGFQSSHPWWRHCSWPDFFSVPAVTRALAILSFLQLCSRFLALPTHIK